MSNSAYLKSISLYHSQLRESWKEITNLTFKPEYKKVGEVIIGGMGASTFGYRVVSDAFKGTRLMVPVSLLEEYQLPEYADEKTLFIATSYSGNTEEVLCALKEAKSRGCIIYGITSGGIIGKMIKDGEIPGYVFDTRNNPSGASRTSVGYMVGATLGLLAKLGHLELGIREFNEFVDYVEAYTKILIENTSFSDKIANQIKDTIPVFITAEHTLSATHIWRNFLNETAKTLGFTCAVPAMNHHFLDGLKYPESAKANLLFVYVLSGLHNDKNKVRLRVSREVNKKYGYRSMGIDLNGGSVLKEIFELIILGSLVSYKIAEIRKEDPVANEMVDYLKLQLKSV